METPASALPPMSRISYSFLQNFVKPHDKESITSASSIARPTENHETSDVTNGFAVTNNVALDESLHLLLTDDCDWLFKMEQLTVCDMETWLTQSK